MEEKEVCKRKPIAEVAAAEEEEAVSHAHSSSGHTTTN
jgi:hypothetical protein